jgi:PII-like signaling protein
MLILVGEADRLGDVTLYEAITRKLIQLDAPGATVQAGIMGFGNHHKIHGKHLFGVSDDRPITIAVVAPEVLLREKIVPAIRAFTKDALILLLDAEVV